MSSVSADQLSLPSVSGLHGNQQIGILLINPNSSEYMTRDCLNAITRSLPPDVTVEGFTAPHPAPTAIESQTDAVLSTEACVRAIVPIAARYDAFLVACFRDHPLISVLREELSRPVIGIMEAALYASRMVGDKLGIISVSGRSQAIHSHAVVSYGFADYFAGCEAAQLAVLELDSRPREEVHALIMDKVRRLANEKGADCILLGCAGMAEMRKICEEAVRDTGVRVIDGIGIGVQFLVGLVRENIDTAKSGTYRSSASDRLRRNQDWL